MKVADLFARLGLRPDKKEWAAGDRLVSGLKRAVLGLGAVVGAVKLTGLINDTAAAGAHATEAAARLGITAEAVQELAHAASLSGASFEELEGGLSRFARGLSDAAKTGKGPAADALRKLKIPIKELTKESLDQNFEQIAAALAKLPDGAKKADIAMDLFGKGGAKLIPLLNEGQAGIVKLRNEAHELGKVIDGDTAAALEAFGDDQDRVKASLEGLRNEVVIALLPSLRSMVTGLLGWVKANRAVIASGLKALVDALLLGFRALGFVIAGVTKALAFLGEHSEIATALLTALGTALAVAAARAAIAWAVAAAPVVAFIAAIAAVVLAVRGVIRIWPRLVQAVRAAMSRIRDFVFGVATSIRDGFAAVGRFIAAPFIAAFNLIMRAIGPVIDAIKFIIDKAEAVGSVVKKIFGRSEALENAVPGLRQFVNPGAAAAPTRPAATQSAPATQTSAVAVDVGGITVNAAPGMDEAALARATREEFDRNLTRHLRHAAAGVGVP